LESWPVAKNKMLRFAGHWVISHMAFLHQYFSNEEADRESLKQAEIDVFNIEFMKKYKLKYYLKKNFPKTHDQVVNLKRMVS
jgi:hypothetical protein